MSTQLQSKNQQSRLLQDTELLPQTTAVKGFNASIKDLEDLIRNTVAPQQNTESSDLMGKVKTFFTKPITSGSKIQYWHVAVGLLIGFVLYVEMLADRKTQRKLKFW